MGCGASKPAAEAPPTERDYTDVDVGEGSFEIGRSFKGHTRSVEAVVVAPDGGAVQVDPGLTPGSRG